ncbi:MAG: hypothetical protein H7Z39_18610 [Burkholderiaceae bacterium]|nr:hypothetical protein [Burkholderiaceae bacterium]
MKSWPEALRDGVATGAVASVLSTVVLALRGRRESGSTYAPTNAISHWLWGERAAHQNRPSARYTLPGYLIHHASSMLWATLYEKWFGRLARRAPPAQVLGAAAAVSALACFVDYQLTPQRLHPGFERRLSGPSLWLVYGAFGLGLALPHLLRGRR